MNIDTPISDRYQVHRIENPYAFAELEVMRLLSRWSPDMDRWTQLAKLWDQGGVVVWGASGRPDKLEGLLILALPIDALQDTPQVVYMCCDGGLKLKRRMIQTLVEFVREHGYTKFMAINDSGYPDEVWARAFREGGKITKRCSIFSFDIGPHNGSPAQVSAKTVNRRAKNKKTTIRKRTDERKKKRSRV